MKIKISKYKKNNKHKNKNQNTTIPSKKKIEIGKYRIYDFQIDNERDEELIRYHRFTYFITCAVCGNTKAVAFYSEEYKGYLADCSRCDDQWKLD